jgi:hypothetical protein
VDEIGENGASFGANLAENSHYFMCPRADDITDTRIEDDSSDGGMLASSQSPWGSVPGSSPYLVAPTTNLAGSSMPIMSPQLSALNYPSL